MKEETRQLIGVIIAFAVAIGFALALLKAQETFNDPQFDYSAVVIYKEFSGEVGGSPGMDIWQVRLEDRRIVAVPSNVQGGHMLGDCVTVRMISDGNMYGRGLRIIGSANDCDTKVAQ